jgi:signal transduction histidine kinase
MKVVFAGPSRAGLAAYLRSCGDSVDELPPDDELALDLGVPAVVLCCAAAARSHPRMSGRVHSVVMFFGDWRASGGQGVAADALILPDELDDAQVRRQLLSIHDRAGVVHASTAALEKSALLRRKFEEARDEFLRFTERVSHDMQSVLQNIEGFAKVLQERASLRLDDKEVHYLERIRVGSAKGSDVVRDAAFMARAAWAPLHRSSVDLGAVVERCVAQLGARESGRVVHWKVAALPRVRGDESAIQLAVWHLLDNALKFTRDRDEASIEVRAHRNAGRVEIEVRDNGIGFDPGYAQRLFQPFERLHAATFEGNGIGLSFVRTVARRHGGDARAALLAEGGACFAFDLPEADTGPLPAAEDPPAAGGPRPLRVLLVDDDPLVLLTIKGMLERDGHSVTVASGVQVALEELERQPEAFDLAISDWAMPHLGGAHLVSAIAANHPRTAIFLLTGQGPEDPGGLPANVRGVLHKPIRQAELRAALAGLG